ncbi:MAG: HU family DNA-binding protein [Burkholderiales bacterium]
MNKRDLVDAIARKTGGTKVSVEAILKAVVDTVTGTLAKGGKVAIIGFGTFSTSKRAARIGRNPVTGAAIKIPAAKVAKFSAGAGLKKAVNKK